MKRLVFALLIPLLGCGTSETEREPLFRVEVNAGAFDRVNPLVSVPVSTEVTEVQLFETTSGLRTPVPSQIDFGAEKRLYWVLSDETEREVVRTYAAYEVDPEGEPIRKPREYLSIHNEEGKYLEVRYEDSPVLRYNYGIVTPPEEGTDPLQARNAYIHPAWTPSGRIVTDDFNPDHLHQRGIWNAWTRTKFEGRTPDFWNLGEGTGTVRFDKIEMIQGGPVFVGFRLHQRHVDLSAPGGEKDVLKEVWDVRVYSLGGPRTGYFLFDIDSVQTTAGDSPLELPEYHYGGMGFRGAREWTPDVTTFLTSKGDDRKSGDGAQADWCAIEGTIKKGPAGALVMSHPGNFRSPQPLRIHPEMPYFAFSPQRAGDMKIEPGEPYRSKFRFLVYDGKMNDPLARGFWEDYASPPEAKVLEQDPSAQ